MHLLDVISEVEDADASDDFINYSSLDALASAIEGTCDLLFFLKEVVSPDAIRINGEPLHDDLLGEFELLLATAEKISEALDI